MKYFVNEQLHHYLPFIEAPYLKILKNKFQRNRYETTLSHNCLNGVSTLHLNHCILWILQLFLPLLPFLRLAAASKQQSEEHKRQGAQHERPHDHDAAQGPWLLLQPLQEPVHPLLTWTCEALMLRYSAEHQPDRSWTSTYLHDNNIWLLFLMIHNSNTE